MSKHRSFTSIFVLIGFGTLLAGVLACSAGGAASGGGDDSTEEALTQEASPLDGLNPCTIVTQEDVSAIFGGPAEPGKDTYSTGASLCTYANPDATMGFSFLLGYDSEGGANAFDFTSQKELGATDISGLGDAAYINAMHHLTVAKGNWCFIINGLINGEALTQEQLTPLAQTVLGRLP